MFFTHGDSCESARSFERSPPVYPTMYPTDSRFSVSRIHKPLLITLFCLSSIILIPGVGRAQTATLTDDSFTTSGSPNGNRGTNISLNVSQKLSGAAEVGYVKFNLTTSLPAGTTAENVSKASLKLFVNRVAVSGLVDVYRTSASWTEKTITITMRRRSVVWRPVLPPRVSINTWLLISRNWSRIGSTDRAAAV